MTPAGMAAAQGRIGILLQERRGVLAAAVSRKVAEFSAHGAFRSSMCVIAVHGVLAEELDARSQLAWGIIRSVLDNEGWSPREDDDLQVKTMLEEALGAGSQDIEEHFSKASSRMPGKWATLDGPRAFALEKALADAAIDRVGRKARYVQLLDMLEVPRYTAGHAHWRKAVEFAGGAPPDYANAVREAVTAVESLAQVVLGKTGLTLGDAVKELRSRKVLPVGADQVLDGLWAFANASPGTRHGAIVPPLAEKSDWEFAQRIAEAGARLLLVVDAPKGH